MSFERKLSKKFSSKIFFLVVKCPLKKNHSRKYEFLVVTLSYEIIEKISIKNNFFEGKNYRRHFEFLRDKQNPVKHPCKGNY